MNHRLPPASLFTFRPIAPADDAAMAAIIREVMPSFGASGAGFALNDPEVAHLSGAYAAPRHAYFVVTDAAGMVVGGAGIAPLAGAAPELCELRKMYFLPRARGSGMGERLLRHCLAVATGLGYRQCYLETLRGMDAALRLYAKCGFQPLAAPLGATGHFSCDCFYWRALDGAD
jgi:putative acetyltransferase